LRVCDRKTHCNRFFESYNAGDVIVWYVVVICRLNRAGLRGV